MARNAGEDPLECLNDCGGSVTVGGLKWFPEGDFISINIGDLSFAKQNRGRKSQDMKGIIPDEIIKRHCVGKIAEMFDPLGRVTPSS